jgi:hypothetical protein
MPYDVSESFAVAQQVQKAIGAAVHTGSFIHSFINPVDPDTSI